MQCSNCHGDRLVSGHCLDCGYETAEKTDRLETTAKKTAPRRHTVEKR